MTQKGAALNVRRLIVYSNRTEANCCTRGDWLPSESASVLCTRNS